MNFIAYLVRLAFAGRPIVAMKIGVIQLNMWRYLEAKPPSVMFVDGRAGLAWEWATYQISIDQESDGWYCFVRDATAPRDRPRSYGQTVRRAREAAREIALALILYGTVGRFEEVA